MRCFTQLEQVARLQAWQRVIVGICWVLVTVVLTAGVLIGLDYLFGFHAPALRLLLSAVLVSSGLWAASRLLTCQPKITPAQVALQLEPFYPELGDRLASAVQFYQAERAEKSPSPALGSAALRRAFLLRMAQEVEAVDWNRLRPRRALWRALLAVVVMAAGVGGVATRAPQVFQIGLVRLLHPLGWAEWPRRHELQWIDPPTFVAADEEFEVRLRDRRAALPEKVWIHYRVPATQDGPWSGRWRETTEPMRRSGQTMVARRIAGSTPFEIRATGGDDHTMTWHAVRVAQRPRVESLKITALPPAYSGRAAGPLEPPYRTLAGARLEIGGTSNVPLGRLRLLRQAEPGLEARLAADGRSFQIGSLAGEGAQWMVDESETYELELTTLEGWTVRARRRLPLEVVRDRPPRVAWVEPHEDELTVRADARVNVVVAATDDLGLGEVALSCRLTESATAEQGEPIVLFRQAEPHSVHPALVADSPEQATELELPGTINLAGRGYQPGQTLRVDAYGCDFFSIDGKSAPQIGQTVRPLRLRIVSPTALQHLVGQHQALLIERLAKALESQQAVRDRLSAWLPRAATATGGPEQTELVTGQRQVAQWLDRASGRPRARGAVQLLDGLLRLFASNRLVDAETDAQLKRLRADLAGLARQELPEVERRIHDLVLLRHWLPPEQHDPRPPGRAAKTGRLNAGRDQILQQQDGVSGRLQQALDDLARWNTLAQLTGQFQQIERDQRQLFERCRDELAPEYWAGSLGADSGALTLPASEQEGLWADAVAAQRRLARRTGRLIDRMESVAGRRTTMPSEVADRLARVAGAARQLSVQSTLQAATDQLSQRRLGRALTHQQQALKQLQSLGKQLLGRPPADMLGSGRNQAQETARRDFHADNLQPDGSQGDRMPGSAPAPDAAQAQIPGMAPQALSPAVGALVHDLWGTLPTRQRQQILQPLGEDFLPQYADDIAAYFRALAEPAAEQWPRQPRPSEP